MINRELVLQTWNNLREKISSNKLEINNSLTKSKAYLENAIRWQDEVISVVANNRNTVFKATYVKDNINMVIERITAINRLNP